MNNRMDEVYSVTRMGQLQLTGASTRLLANELRMLVLLSKPTPLREIARLIPKAADRDVPAMARDLLQRGYIAPCESTGDDGSIDFLAADIALRPGGAQDEIAAGDAARVRAELARRGFYVSIARRAARQVPPADGHAYSVLVIEDDPYLAKLYNRLLAMMSCRVSNACDRAELQAAMNTSSQPDLILLDLNLPDIGGFDALHWLSSHEKLGSTPVIVASADTTKESIIRALALGADGYITKPIVVESFIDSIRAILGLPAIDRSKEDAWSGVVS